MTSRPSLDHGWESCTKESSVVGTGRKGILYTGAGVRRLPVKATVTTRRTCFCVLSTCKNVGNRTASVRAYERATYGLRESNFTILTCNCCTDSARSMCVPRTVLASSVLTPHFPVDLLNDHAEHTCTIPVYKDDLTGDCQLVSKTPRKAQKKTTRQDPKKRAAEDTRAASDDEVNRRCTHLQRASTACTRQRSNRTEIVRCKHVQLTYHLRNVRCTQPLTARRVVQTTKNVADVATTKTYGQKARTASCDRGLKVLRAPGSHALLHSVTPRLGKGRTGVLHESHPA
ncbi:hypothetical protein Bbelb_041660 [Branchiostoma belcheri]|nr:hypothetical protein Bbelb_041660 [Branchiostoma belcheri]